MGNTQAPHELIYEQALRQIAALDETWQAAVRGATAPVAAPAVVPALVPALAPAVLVAPATAVAPAVERPVAPLPRAPLPVTAEIAAVAGPETAEAVLARAAAPRWRRSLAY